MSIKSLICGFSLWLLVLLMAACERSHPQVEAVLQQAYALMEAHPDSAFSLLDSLHYRQPMSKKETARYALLLAKATDKTYQSLIPCDSLLNFALKYYEKPTADRATALLYKGCLEDEVNHDEEAIEHLQKARLILQNYPEEVGTRRITLGLLGDLYYQYKHYEDCLPVYQETLKICKSDRDKAQLYKDISSYYTMTQNPDSSIYYHYKSLNCALSYGDSSLVADIYHSLGMAYAVLSKPDSALFFVNKSIESSSHGSQIGRYLYSKGLLLYQIGSDKDSVIRLLNLAKADNTFEYRNRVNKLLGAIETDNKNYLSANNYYERYINYMDSLYTQERSIDVQQLIYDYNIKLQIQEERAKSKLKQLSISFSCGIIMLLLIIVTILMYYEREKQKIENKRKYDGIKHELNELQQAIEQHECNRVKLVNELLRKADENERLTNLITKSEEYINNLERKLKGQQGVFQSAINTLKNDLASKMEEADNLAIKIIEQEDVIKYLHEKFGQIIEKNQNDISNLEQELKNSEGKNASLLSLIAETKQYALTMQTQGLHLCTLAFEQTDIYKLAIEKGAHIKATDFLPILSLKERNALKGELFRIYKDYINELLNKHPDLKDEELIYLCLSTTEMEAKIIAMCLGYPKINSYYKMKSRIEVKGLFN